MSIIVASVVVGEVKEEVDTALSIAQDSKKDFLKRQVAGVRATSMLDMGLGGKSGIDTFFIGSICLFITPIVVLHLPTRFLISKFEYEVDAMC